MTQLGFPEKQGLYDPRHEHDACGTGFVVDIKGRKSHDIVQKAIQVLLNLEHRGACGSEKNTGDGAGILLQIPHVFLAAKAAKLKIELPPPVNTPSGWCSCQKKRKAARNAKSYLKRSSKKKANQC